MSSPPTFTVVIPTRDRPRYLREAVESVLRQTHTDFEVVVVDDAGELPVELPSDSRIRVVRHPRRKGPGAARNTGIREARGRFVTFLDDDDLYTADRLASALTTLERSPIAVCWSAFLDGQTAPNRLLDGDVYDVVLDDYTPHVGAVAIRRDLVPEFNEEYLACQDIEWWLRVAATGSVATDPTVGYLIRRHDAVRDLNGLEVRIQYSLRLLRDHREYFRHHRMAAGFRWWRVGSMAHTLGNYRLARRAYLRSLLLRPSAGTAWRLFESCVSAPKTLRP